MLTCASFGDKCAGIIAMLALRSTAEMYLEQYPEAANIIIRNSYVDDIIGGSHDAESACKLMEEIEWIVSRGGFKFKHFMMSGVVPALTRANIIEVSENKVLGVSWTLQPDYISFKPKINFSDKYRKVHKRPDLGVMNFENNVPAKLTKRMVLSIMAAQYDPLGLISSFMLKGKMLMRKLAIGNSESKYDWDDMLSDDIKSEWVEFFREMFLLETMKFPRCFKTITAKGDPMLVMFSDASNTAFGACAYIRYELLDGSYYSSLVAAKCKMAPLKSMTIPRLELSGAIVSVRLGESLVKELSCKFSKIVYIVDSAIVRSQIQKESYGFGTFTATKIAEIQSKSDPNDWWWISGIDNPADMTTRPVSPLELNEGSIWQLGPPFLVLPFDSWPIRKDPVKDLPDKINVYSIQCGSSTCLTLIDVIVLDRYSCYYKMIRVTCRLLSVFTFKSFKGMLRCPNVCGIKVAELKWFKCIQSTLGSDWESRFCRLGPMLDSDGLIIVGQRISNWLKFNYDKSGFILLPANHMFTRLLVTSIHNTCHAGIETILAKVQVRFWIPKARNLIRSIQLRCVICRKLRKQIAGQIMGPLPVERISPSPSFAFTALDLFGPFYIKDTVKKRTKGKAYGVIFNCLSSRAVYLDLIDGYDTKSFTDGFRRFISIRGCPRQIYSDCGSQLNSFNKELQDVSSKLNMEEIQNCASQFGGEIVWKFTAANAPWQNGVSEALIKSVKKSLTVAIGDSVLTFSRLQTTLFEISNLLNQRPIGIKPAGDIELGRYLCPNDLLLGRTSGHAPSGNLDENPSFQNILDFNCSIVDAFWRKWTRDFWPSLIVRQKWHFERRNLCVGDIVTFQDSNLLKGHWKLGEVVLADVSKDNKVRNVHIRYKPQREGVYKGDKDIVVKRSAHRIVVLLPIEER